MGRIWGGHVLRRRGGGRPHIRHGPTAPKATPSRAPAPRETFLEYLISQSKSLSRPRPAARRPPPCAPYTFFLKLALVAISGQGFKF